MIIGGGVTVVVILVAVVMNTGDEPPTQQSPPAEVANKKTEPESRPAVVHAKSENRPSKVLKTPDTPAPAIAAAVLAKVDAMYAKAKKLDLEARRAQKAGEGDKFNQLINDSWDVLEQLEESITEYTNWLEEADMDDWRVPREYRPLQNRLTKVDHLKGLIKRVKPNRR